MKFKLQLMPDGERWGVYVKPDDSIFPHTGQTIVGSGQVTVVMPVGYQWSNLQSVNGSWLSTPPIDGPMENPTKRYQTFGFNSEIIPIPFQNGLETLLFTFKNIDTCPLDIHLIDNDTDPFTDPYSWDLGNNPGNEITVFDIVTGNVYEYSGNYAPFAWDCHDNDGDGILNAHEDTNGNGVFDPSEDDSDLNATDLAQSNDDIQFKLQLMPDGEFWGVYAKPKNDANISLQTITGTGQVTVVMPADYEWSSLTNVSGNWSAGGVINAPSFAPDKQYCSFGLMNDFPQIKFTPGQETLLFKFKKEGNCPDDLHLYPSDGVLPPNSQWNLANDIFIFDIPSSSVYSYGGNYAEMAWDCHDNDGDGIANGIEDTNGNGVFDPGVDASDLGQAELPSCVKLKLQLLPDSSGWAVVARSFGGIAPNGTTTLEAGRVTIVTPSNFQFGGVETGNGLWEATTVLANMPNSPNKKYITIEMMEDSAPMDIHPGVETTLFTFDKLGDCPISLSILENSTSAGPLPNELSGHTAIGLAQHAFAYCGVYARKAWRCKKPQGGPIIIVTEDELGGTGTTDRNEDDAFGDNTENEHFLATPNPAGDHVDIAISSEMAEGHPTLSLFDLQGLRRIETQLETTATKLDLSSLPAGVYFVSLAQNGQPLQRRKLVKH